MKKNNNSELTHHYIEARNLLLQAEETMREVSAPIKHTSEKFGKTNQTYSGYKSTLQKSNFFLHGLKSQHQINLAIVYGSFFFLVIVVGFIVLRRLFWRNFYSDLPQIFINRIQQIWSLIMDEQDL